VRLGCAFSVLCASGRRVRPQLPCTRDLMFSRQSLVGQSRTPWCGVAEVIASGALARTSTRRRIPFGAHDATHRLCHMWGNLPAVSLMVTATLATGSDHDLHSNYGTQPSTPRTGELRGPAIICPRRSQVDVSGYVCRTCAEFVDRGAYVWFALTMNAVCYSHAIPPERPRRSLETTAFRPLTTERNSRRPAEDFASPAIACPRQLRVNAGVPIFLPES
jgi:hypothetical protein